MIISNGTPEMLTIFCLVKTRLKEKKPRNIELESYLRIGKRVTVVMKKGDIYVSRTGERCTFLELREKISEYILDSTLQV